MIVAGNIEVVKLFLLAGVVYKKKLLGEAHGKDPQDKSPMSQSYWNSKPASAQNYAGICACKHHNGATSIPLSILPILCTGILLLVSAC